MAAGASSAAATTTAGLVAVQLAQLLGPRLCHCEDYENLHLLGQGAHGTIRVVRRKHDGHMLCKKWISFERLPSSAHPTQVLREVEILMMLSGHPHVIGFVGAFAGDGGLNIVQEYAEGGTLLQRLDRQRADDEPLTEPEVLDTFVQISAALAHLHAHGVLHRDVKPANVFFDRRNLCRLGDFGIASSSKDPLPSKFLGTPLYLSPELIEGRPCDHKADLWALGVLLYEMVALHHPFAAENLAALALKITRAEFEPLASAVGLKQAASGGGAAHDGAGAGAAAAAGNGSGSGSSGGGGGQRGRAFHGGTRAVGGAAGDAAGRGVAGGCARRAPRERGRRLRRRRAAHGRGRRAPFAGGRHPPQ